MTTRRASTSPALSDERFHAIARAIADPRRFAIMQQIASSANMPCSALNAHDEISAATISHHIKELTEAGLVTAERDGRTMSLSFSRLLWDAYCKRLAAL